MNVPQENSIIHGDCIEGMRHMADASADLIITDPPFAIDFKAQRSNYNRESDRVLGGYREIAAEDYAEFSFRWMREAFRVLKNSGSCFIFSGWNNLKDILVSASQNGFHTVNHIIWKYQFGVVCSRKFVTSHYHCLYLCKSDKDRKFYLNSRFSQEDKTASGGSARYKDLEDVWIINREYWTGDKKTPTKLPRELVEKILSYASAEGDLVLDPFSGSGQVAVISRMMGRRYIAFEIAEDYCKFARERISSNSYRLKSE